MVFPNDDYGYWWLLTPLKNWLWWLTGWWYTYPSEKYEFGSWDDDIPNCMESHKSHVPNHQPVKYIIIINYLYTNYGL